MILTLGAGVEMQFVWVPAGAFRMGSSLNDKSAFSDEYPQLALHLPDYFIGKYPVTVAQFALFVAAAGYQCGAELDVLERGPYPVVRVSWRDALAFCRWAGETLRRRLRLPSEAEWEKAARGADGRLYPWGDQPAEATRCNMGMSVHGPTIVGRYSPQGDSPYGCADMAGNVWEWTSSLHRPYPYRADDGRENPASRGRRVLRGGSWYDPERLVRAANRGAFNATPWLDGVGFRCACSL